MFFQNGRAKGKDEDHARYYQNRGKEGNEEDTPSAGWEFAADNPVLDNRGVSFVSSNREN